MRHLLLLEAATILLVSFLPVGAVTAQTLTWHSWDPYTDKYGLINDSPVDKSTGIPSTNNGPLYTAEACTIMQLRNVPYDRTSIASAIARCEVKKGLYEHSPWDAQDQDTVDDYIGLGALAGICGFHDIAQDILDYGNSTDQVVRDTALGLNPIQTGKEWLGLLRKALTESPVGTVVPYNYNNLHPGQFSEASWMGRYPALIIHWKLAAGRAPSAPELVIWSAALEFSARTHMHDGEHDAWLQSWLMVLTYQTSGFRSAVADAAVANWWNLMHQRWPGGIKQAMTDDLGAGAPGNPLSEFIEDFKDARGPFVDFVDEGDPEQDLVSSVEDLLASLSPTDFLAPFDNAVATFWTAINVQQKAVDLQASAVNKATQTINSISKSIDDLNAQKDDAAKKLTNAVAQKADMLAKGLDKIRLPGHFVTPTAWGIPIGPPVFVPGKWQDNDAFTALVKSIADLTNLISDLDKKIADFLTQKQQAVNDLAASSVNLANAKAGLGLAVEAAKKAAPVLDKLQNALANAEAVVFNLIPGVALPIDTSQKPPDAAPALFVLQGIQLSPTLQEQLEKDAESFQKQTGLSMTIISGPRTAKEQAASMFDCMKDSGDPAQYVSVYRDQVTAQKVLSAFKANVNDRDAAIAEMARIIGKTIGTNEPFSNHFYDGGYDVKTEGFTDDQKEQLLKVLVSPPPGNQIAIDPHTSYDTAIANLGGYNQIIIAVPRDRLPNARQLRKDLYPIVQSVFGLRDWLLYSRMGVELALREHVHVNVLKAGQEPFPAPDAIIMPKRFTIDYYLGEINTPWLAGKSVWTRTSETTWEERRSNGSRDTYQAVRKAYGRDYRDGGPIEIVRSKSHPKWECLIPDIQANPTVIVATPSLDIGGAVGDMQVEN